MSNKNEYRNLPHQPFTGAITIVVVLLVENARWDSPSFEKSADCNSERDLLSMHSKAKLWSTVL